MLSEVADWVFERSGRKKTTNAADLSTNGVCYNTTAYFFSRTPR
jgi:hypothetical protein